MSAAAPLFPPARRWREPRDTRLLVLDPCAGAWRHGAMHDVAAAARAGDVLVVNDAATLPASLTGRSARGPVELRLASRLPRDAAGFRAVVFGAGSWRAPTELRPRADLAVGDHVDLAPGLGADVLALHAGGRLADVRFTLGGDALWRALYAHGRPIQYSYLEADLPLWAVQNVYAARPWSCELASAGRGLTWDVLLALCDRGVVLARLTHAAGISSTGDAALDAALPWPEASDIPAATVAAIAAAKARGSRVLAVGTSVVRALEGRVARDGALTAGEGTTDLVLGPGHRLRVVDGLLTGLHEPTASHFQLLQTFARGALIADAYADAARRGYLGHELGDANLILCA